MWVGSSDEGSSSRSNSRSVADPGSSRDVWWHRSGRRWRGYRPDRGDRVRRHQRTQRGRRELGPAGSVRRHGRQRFVLGRSEPLQDGRRRPDSEDCRIVAYVNSIQEYWSGTVRHYKDAPTVFFTGQTSSACGEATTDSGPFYCPSDGNVYIDLGFFQELTDRFGAKGVRSRKPTCWRMSTVITSRTSSGCSRREGRAVRGPRADSVRTELQADCYAGVWAANAVQTGFITNITDQDVADALDAAAAVGTTGSSARPRAR